MKLSVAFLLLLTLLVVLAAIPASGQTYSNGPLNGNYDAWTINFGYIVSDTFTMAQPTTLLGFDFYTWSAAGDTPLTVDWSITSSENGGTVYGSGAGAALTNVVISTNSYNYQINREVVSNLNVGVSVGTYWLNLQNAVTSQGKPLYWDENDGPSQASDSELGTIGSETFEIHGCADHPSGDRPDCGPPVPEPGSILLFGSGAIGLAGILRRKIT